jgi:hypothetical protein
MDTLGTPSSCGIAVPMCLPPEAHTAVAMDAVASLLPRETTRHESDANKRDVREHSV